MIDEQRLYNILATICEYLKAWHESFDAVEASTYALVQAVKDKQPELAKVYDRRLQECLGANSDRYGESRRLIDGVIAALKAGKI